MTYNNDIDGWMGYEELQWLYNTAGCMETIVEIGSWKGRSTHALLSGCEGTVWAVDHFKGSNGREFLLAEAKEKDIHKIFLGNVGHFKNLKVLKMNSLKASEQFEDGSVDMVFIDGDHAYEAVKADIKAWFPKARKLICGHDYPFRGVRKAVHEIFHTVRVKDNIWGIPLG